MDFDVVARFADVVGEVFGATLAELLFATAGGAFAVVAFALACVTDFFFLFVEVVVEVCGDAAPAHAPMARAANKATGTGTTISRKSPV